MRKNIKSLLTFNVTADVQLIAFIMEKMHYMLLNKIYMT